VGQTAQFVAEVWEFRTAGNRSIGARLAVKFRWALAIGMAAAGSVIYFTITARPRPAASFLAVLPGKT
jgi:hypothetical protein